MFAEHYRLSNEDVERLKNGGPLSLPERMLVEQFVAARYDWFVGRGHYTMRWSDEWQDGMHVEGPPCENWDGNGYYPGADNRQLILGMYGPAEDEEPVEADSTMLEIDTFLKSL